jgi:hypothetical protein
MINNSEELAQLPVWASIESTKNLLTSMKTGDSRGTATLAGLHFALDRLAAIRNQEVWFFTTDFVAKLSILNTTISNLGNLVTTYLNSSDENGTAWSSILVETENLLNLMRQNGLLADQLVEVKESTKSIRDFTNSVVDGMHQIDTEKSNLVAQIQNLTNLIAAQETLLKSEISVVKSSQDEFKQLIASLEKEANTALESIDGKNRSSLNAIKESAELSVQEINGLLNASKKLSERVYWDKVSKSYAEYSLKQGGMALLYSSLTIAAGVLTVLQSKYLFTNTQELSAGGLNIKFAGSIASVALFAFLATETAGYRHQARDAKRTQLDLSSVEPAIANMDEGDSKSIRIQVVQQTFARPRPTVERWVDRVMKRK